MNSLQLKRNAKHFSFSLEFSIKCIYGKTRAPECQDLSISIVSLQPLDGTSHSHSWRTVERWKPLFDKGESFGKCRQVLYWRSLRRREEHIDSPWQRTASKRF